MRLARALAVLGTASTAALIVLACSDDGVTASPCTSIPAGGCPIAHGVACEDPSCEAVYACQPENVWTLVQRCPAHDAAAREPSDASPDADAAPAPRDAAIDAPPGAFGGPGCGDLVLPDCPLGVALACGSGCCGCEDLFVCNAGGWDLWGACGDGGPVSSP